MDTQMNGCADTYEVPLSVQAAHRALSTLVVLNPDAVSIIVYLFSLSGAVGGKEIPSRVNVSPPC